MFAKFGGWARAARATARRTRPRRSTAKQLVVGELVADASRRSSGSCPGRRTSSRPGGRARPPSRAAGRAARRAATRKIPRAPSVLSTARSGRATSPTNSVSPVRTAQGSCAAGAVDERERRVLGPVAGGVQRADAHVAELELPAVVERFVVVVGLGVAVHVDRRAGRRRQAAVAGHVVGVVVRLEDVLDRARPGSARSRRYSSISKLRVDDGDHPAARRRPGTRHSRGRRAGTVGRSRSSPSRSGPARSVRPNLDA